MITAIEIENFKAFGSKQRIELAPITLIYGENSAGKTSILQALNLLKQTHESRESGASLLPRAEDGIVDLGSFNELLFDHDAERTLRLGVELCPDKDDRESRTISQHRLFGDEGMGVQLSFRRAKKTGEVGLSELNISFPEKSHDLAAFTPRVVTDRERVRLLRAYWSPVRSQRAHRLRLTGVECTRISDSPDLWEPYYKAWHARRGDVTQALKSGQIAELRRHSVYVDDDEHSSEQNWQHQIAEAAAFYSKDFGLNEFIERLRKWALGTLIMMDGFVPSAPGGSSRHELPELLLGEPAPCKSRKLHGLPVLDVSHIAFLIGRLLEESLTSLFPMGPFRRPPQRWYIFTGTSPLDVGYKGDHLPDLLFRRPELVTKANQWLTRLEIGYQLRVRPVGERESDLFEVRLVDVRRGTEVEVGLADVGFGISQILPFIVQCLASEDQLLSIEQPEVHIHPRLQADLGELIAEATKQPYGHRFLIETHSEHLLLRLQRLVRSGQLGPKDISVNYVTRGKDGSTVDRLRLDDKGDFIDEWPNGFFPERLRELR